MNSLFSQSNFSESPGMMGGGEWAAPMGIHIDRCIIANVLSKLTYWLHLCVYMPIYNIKSDFTCWQSLQLSIFLRLPALSVKICSAKASSVTTNFSQLVVKLYISNTYFSDITKLINNFPILYKPKLAFQINLLDFFVISAKLS